MSIVETGMVLSLGAPVRSSIAIGNIGFRCGFDVVAVVDIVANQAQSPSLELAAEASKFYRGGGRHSLLVCCIFFSQGRNQEVRER